MVGAHGVGLCIYICDYMLSLYSTTLLERGLDHPLFSAFYNADFLWVNAWVRVNAMLYTAFDR